MQDNKKSGNACVDCTVNTDKKIEGDLVLAFNQYIFIVSVHTRYTKHPQ